MATALQKLNNSHNDNMHDLFSNQTIILGFKICRSFHKNPTTKYTIMFVRIGYLGFKIADVAIINNKEYNLLFYEIHY